MKCQVLPTSSSLYQSKQSLARDYQALGRREIIKCLAKAASRLYEQGFNKFSKI